MTTENKEKMNFQDVIMWRKKRLSEGGDLVYTDITINEKAQEILKVFSVEGEQTGNYIKGLDEDDNEMTKDFKRYLIKSVIRGSHLNSKGELLFIKDLIDNRKTTIETFTLEKAEDIIRDMIRNLREIAEVYSGLEVTSTTTLKFE